MSDMIYYIIGGGACVLLLILIIIRVLRRSRLKGNNVEQIKGVRYTTTSEYTETPKEEDLDVKISYNKTDIIIPVKEERKIGKKADIKPGKYIILTTVEGTDALNIRLGGYVRVYPHGSEIILAEGDTICPVNVGIILR